jgi:hypothetical protein
LATARELEERVWCKCSDHLRDFPQFDSSICNVKNQDKFEKKIESMDPARLQIQINDWNTKAVVDLIDLLKNFNENMKLSWEIGDMIVLKSLANGGQHALHTDHSKQFVEETMLNYNSIPCGLLIARMAPGLLCAKKIWIFKFPLVVLCFSPGILCMVYQKAYNGDTKYGL